MNPIHLEFLQKRNPIYLLVLIIPIKNIMKISKKIDKSFEELYTKLESGKYKGIILPENGIGTGLAKLPERLHKLLNIFNII